MAPFAEATTVKAIDSHTYLANFPEDWCIGNAVESETVPHGGFVTSCFLSATALHFSTTHASLNQPHTITLHLTFLRRNAVGRARFSFRDMKLGRRTSTVHVALTQGDDKNAEPCVVGYLTQSNLQTETGVSLSTNWQLHPPPVSLTSTTALRGGKGREENWVHSVGEHASFRKASQKTKWWVPRQGQRGPGMADEWLCWADGGKFTQSALGVVVDQFPQLVEIYPGTQPLDASGEDADIGKKKRDRKPNWYPTVLLNLDVKKALPEEGVNWLFVRVRAKKIQNGRKDLEVVVLDEGGDLVAISNHVCLILDVDRNMKRSEKTKGVDDDRRSKL
ncbi:MAG: hypothetical protein LQ352_001277 [Teloschistes flavicans]|nr:MAG: hypothetical protein LQ352_001277 [Teloschistes flavicans]